MDDIRCIVQVITTIFPSFFIASYISASAQEQIELSNGEVVNVFFEEHSNGYRYEVTFQNGNHYYFERSGAMGHGGGSLELTTEERELAEEAIDQYEKFHQNERSSRLSSGNPIGLLFIFIGLFGFAFPHAAWYLEFGWKLRDAEPSEFALIAHRVGGAFIVLIGLFILL